MAPIAPTKPKPSSTNTTKTAAAPAKRLTAREKARARLADPLLPRKLHRENNVVTDSFINSKRDKRLIKRSAFVSRIAKAKPSSSAGPARKRRRPSKKLVATLESLGDALDDIREAMDADDDAAGGSAQGGAKNGGMVTAEGKIRHRSLKSRPGALKKKERVVRGEMERFGRSLAQLSGISGSTSGTAGDTVVEGKEMDTEMPAAGEAGDRETQAQLTSATSNRWAALRGFISASMEQSPAFLGKT